MPSMKPGNCATMRRRRFCSRSQSANVPASASRMKAVTAGKAPATARRARLAASTTAEQMATVRSVTTPCSQPCNSIAAQPVWGAVGAAAGAGAQGSTNRFE